jgi:TolB-like protein/DNA-binding winged helix-turn-helix (wHTH) protein/Tfp pilus assembly protein PilF
MSMGPASKESGAPRRIVRFAVFEIDLGTGELRKHGLRIKLSGQPVALLAMLLEHSGEVVTREELQRRLWPADTHVDFEHSLNAAIKRLRAALGDSAEAPRFVETLARQGYRFIAPLSHPVETYPNGNQPATHAPQLAVENLAGHAPAGRQHWVLVTAAAGFAFLIATGLAMIGFNVGGLRDSIRGRLGASPIRSLAVLPLANLSGNPDQDSFADGMTDALGYSLEGINGLRVISRTSSMHYRGSTKMLPEIARELKVDAVIEGSVLRFGDRIRITVQLVQASTDRRLWGNSYEGDLGELFALQSEVAGSIAAEIHIALTPPDRARLARVGASNPDSYFAYSKGRFLWNKRTEADVKRAIEQFQQAIKKDPNSALNYDGLADCWVTMGWYGYLSPTETFPQAKAAATKALRLDDSLAEVHTSLAFVSLYWDRDWTKADAEFRRAIELNPNYANAHHWYGEYLSLAGRHEQAIAESQRARELDPLSNIINTWVGSRYFFARRYDKAIEQYRDAEEMDPGFVPAHLVLGQAYEQKGMLKEAAAELERAVSLSGGSPLYVASLAHARGLAGQRTEAMKLIEDLKEMSRHRFVSSYDLALAHLGVGEKDQALALLGQAVEERTPRIAFLGIEPRFDPLRADARFKKLMSRVGLSP